MTASDVLIQTGASDEVAGALKARAALRRVPLHQVHAEAIEEFFEHRQRLHKRRQSVPYLISPRHSRPLNVRVLQKLAKRVHAAADEDNVPPRRFVYTALIHYVTSHKLVESIGTVVSGVVDVDAPEIAKLKRAQYP